MAYNPYENHGKNGNNGTRPAGNGGFNGGNRGGYNNAPRPPFGQQAAAPVAPSAKEIPEDYAAAAEQVILQPAMISNISTSKLRNFFALFIDMYNDVKHSAGEQLTEEQANALTGARIRMIYECGRDMKVKNFVNAAQLIPYLLSIGNSSSKLIRFYHYFEALVAYHKFYSAK